MALTEPDYPVCDQLAGREGMVVLKLEIGADGAVAAAVMQATTGGVSQPRLVSPSWPQQCCFPALTFSPPASLRRAAIHSGVLSGNRHRSRITQCGQSGLRALQV